MVNQVIVVEQIIVFDQIVINQVVVNPFVATDTVIIDLVVIYLIVDVKAVLSTWWSLQRILTLLHDALPGPCPVTNNSAVRFCD